MNTTLISQFESDKTYCFIADTKYSLNTILKESIEKCKKNKCNFEVDYKNFVFMISQNSELEQKLEMYNNHFGFLKES